ncbi:MAG TPA: glycogen/starch/alpha-glucan phosphorylase, partial [Thermoanaerobaculia bacterium]|nr:glycogen/starch/alpha-glucan phosphorylase [Thermoanaerobaculia bacterium]
AGTEASGTGNMKAVLNGGVIIGTLDGANVEIGEAVGPENIFIFGKTAEEVEALKSSGYSPSACLTQDHALHRVVDWIRNQEVFRPLVHAIAENDRYFHCADFPSYVQTQREASEAWTRADDWSVKSILNVARSGRFSADRTIADYAREIWNVEPVPVTVKR